MPVTHTFVSAVADGADATLVRPSNWNADHTLTSQLLMPDGTVGAPSYSFTTQTTQGLAAGLGFLNITAGGNAIELRGSSFAPATASSHSLGRTNIGWSSFYLDYTNTATVGAVTINMPSGRVNIAAGGTSVVVTNSLVNTTSHVFAVMSTNDSTGRVTAVVPAAGSFTIFTVAVTAQASFDFLVVNGS